MMQGAFSIPDIDGMVESLVMDYNLSLMALDKDKNLLAVTLNGDFHRDEIDMPRQEVTKTTLILMNVKEHYLWTPPSKQCHYFKQAFYMYPN